MKKLSDWWFAADRKLQEILMDRPAELTRKQIDRLISMGAYCRAQYIHALNTDYGPEETGRILERQAKGQETKVRLLPSRLHESKG